MKDKVKLADVDTGKYVVQPFDLATYNNKVAYANRKHIVTPLSGTGLQAFGKMPGRWYFYIWDQHCPMARSPVLKLDSLARAGERVVVISWRQDIPTAENALSKTSFSQYPYYVVDASKYSKVLLRRKVGFIRDACPPCYEQYRDDVNVADLLLLENGKLSVVMYNDTSSVNILAK